ncbi:MAG: YdiY family protein [Lautropia sp.]
MRIRHGITALALAAAAFGAQGQVASKPDGRWRYAIGAGATLAAGNSESAALTINGDAAYQDAARKITLYGNAAYGKSDDVVNTHHMAAGNRWNWELATPWFVFGQGDWFRDRLANLSYRVAANGGLGHHVWRHDNGDFWDLSAGLGYSRDEYSVPTLVADELRTRYGRFEALVASESQHALSDTTTLKQRLALLPNLDEHGEYRATFDAGIAVRMTRQLALTATLAVRRNSDPGTGVKKNDTLFVTGVTWRVE